MHLFLQSLDAQAVLVLAPARLRSLDLARACELVPELAHGGVELDELHAVLLSLLAHCALNALAHMQLVARRHALRLALDVEVLPRYG